MRKQNLWQNLNQMRFPFVETFAYYNLIYRVDMQNTKKNIISNFGVWRAMKGNFKETRNISGIPSISQDSRLFDTGFYWQQLEIIQSVRAKYEGLYLRGKFAWNVI